MVADICCLRTEEEQKQELRPDKRKIDMKQILPSQVRRDEPADDRAEVGGRTQDELDQAHVHSALMHKVQVSNHRDGQGLVRADREALYDLGSEQSLEAVLGGANDRPHEGKRR